jgi:hypothetical protein
MMVNLAQHGEGGGARPSRFTLSTITYKVVMYAAAVRSDTLISPQPFSPLLVITREYQRVSLPLPGS